MIIEVENVNSSLNLNTLKTNLKKLETVMNTYINSELKDIAKKTEKAELKIYLVSDEIIKNINKERRQMDKPTDVLSWKLYEEDINENLILGEIFVSDDYTKQKAEAKGKDINTEILFLISHGFLHICGHTHENDLDEAAMNQATDRLLKKIGIDYYKDII